MGVRRDFNPRSREGSDKENTFYTLNNGISIHAPAKGATHNFFVLDGSLSISIHAPAKGATTVGAKEPQKQEISIHAPAKGATKVENKFKQMHRFQSTLPRRERLYFLLYSTQPCGFQSTLPRRSDGSSSSVFADCKDFNPRSREGSDGFWERVLPL